MKRIIVGFLLAVVLSGCASVENKEIAENGSEEVVKKKKPRPNCVEGRRSTGSRLANKRCR